MAKPSGSPRRHNGYCCEHCDGPYASYLKKIKKKLKQKVKRLIKKDIQEQLEQNEEQES